MAESVESFEVGSLLVERDHSCIEALSWRISRSDGARIDLAAVARDLRAIGFAEVRRMNALEVLCDLAGHQVLFVHTTGRLQVRLHYRVARSKRCAAARAFAGALGRLMGSHDHAGQ